MTPVTYMSIEAQMEDISLQNRKATAELEEMLANQPTFEDSPPAPPAIHWLSIALAFVAGLALGTSVVWLL